MNIRPTANPRRVRPLRRVPGRARGFALGVASTAAIGIAGVAAAAIPDAGTGVIHGCYSTSTGALRVVDPSLGQACASNETGLNWNQRGVNWRGAWSATASYAPHDVVGQGGSSYIAKVANTDSMPPSSNWALLASRGAAGAPGSPGPAGPSGMVGMSNLPSYGGPANPSANWQFLESGYALKTFTDAGSDAYVTVSISMSSTNGSAASGELGVCYEPTAGTTLTSVAAVEAHFENSGGSVYPTSVTGVISGLAPGSYLVGACVSQETANMENLAGAGAVLMGETQP